MSSQGTHFARRPRLSRGQRVLRFFSWPNPAGIALSAAGALLVVAGVAGVNAGYPMQSTTPAPGQAEPSANAFVAQVTQTAQAVAPTSSASASPGQPQTSSSAPVSSSAPKNAASASKSAATKPPVSSASSKRKPPANATAIQKAAVAASTKPSSIYILVNKRNPLTPATFAPSDLRTPKVAAGGSEAVALRTEAAGAVEKMFAVAATNGVDITIASSYRSYTTQKGLYGGYVAAKGQELADTSSARPGFSEHQTGLSLDIGDAHVSKSCEFTGCMASSAAGVWVAAHGAEYGFIIRYPAEAEKVTGYLFEPWHLRYVGVEVAQDMKKHGIASYEQYLGQPAAPSYQ